MLRQITEFIRGKANKLFAKNSDVDIPVTIKNAEKAGYYEIVNIKISDGEIQIVGSPVETVADAMLFHYVMMLRYGNRNLSMNNEFVEMIKLYLIEDTRYSVSYGTALYDGENKYFYTEKGIECKKIEEDKIKIIRQFIIEPSTIHLYLNTSIPNKISETKMYEIKPIFRTKRANELYGSEKGLKLPFSYLYASSLQGVSIDEYLVVLNSMHNSNMTLMTLTQQDLSKRNTKDYLELVMGLNYTFGIYYAEIFNPYKELMEKVYSQKDKKLIKIPLEIIEVAVASEQNYIQ